jgi:hypothetical protein
MGYHYTRSGNMWRMIAQTSTRSSSVWGSFRRHGYAFREAALLTISMGVYLHLVRVTFGDDLTLQYLFTPTSDRVLIVPMTYAAVTGILVGRRVRFAGLAHRVFFTWALAYIALSVPLHVYFGVIRGDLGVYLRFFPMWFSYLLFVLYGAILVMLWRLRYVDDAD